MSKKIDDMKVQLAALSAERDLLDTAIEEMIASMAELPPEQRSSSDWGPDGAMTKKYRHRRKRRAGLIAALAARGGECVCFAKADNP
jgi:hypothetical protein